MPAEENKAVVRRMFEELWDERRLEVADERIADAVPSPDAPRAE